jgi:superfamily II DNA or RNA helicase
LDVPRNIGFQLIILDECHHAVSGTWRKVIDANPKARLLGLTASPERLDGKGLGISCGGVFDAMVIGPSVLELISHGYLVPTRVFAPAHGPDLSEVRTIAGDYDAKQLAEAMDRPSITGDVVRHFQKYAANLSAIAFCSSVQHAFDVAEAFRSAGFTAVAAHGAMPQAARDSALGGLATGAVQIVCAADLVSEGLDIPSVGSVILLRPTKSLSLYLQQVGRGLRPAPGKSHLIVIDHANNTATHGFAETPRKWSLDGRRGRQPAPAIRQCSSCYAVFAPQHRCPVCGHEFVAAAKPRQVEHRDGELAELNREDFLRAAPLKEVTRRAKTLAEFQEIARIRGYKPQWAWIQMQLRGRYAGRAA